MTPDERTTAEETADEIALRIIVDNAAKSWLHPAQQKAALQVAIITALTQARLSGAEEMRPRIAALERVVESARKMPRRTLKAGDAGDVQDYPLESAYVWDLDRALKALDAFDARSLPLQSGKGEESKIP